MKTYYDTGVLLKLYTAEPESPAVEAFVRSRADPIRLAEIHRAECVSALRLKLFRGECTAAQSERAIALIASDLRSGALRMVAVDWDLAWCHCRDLSAEHAAATGVRTLDALHVACAMLLGVGEFVTSDRRQSALAAKVGLKAVDPTAKG